MANSVTHSKNTPIYGVKHTVFLEFRKSDGTTLPPTSLDSEVSLDGGTFANCWEEVTLLKEAGGSDDAAYGYLTLSATEMSSSDIVLQVKSANCVTIGVHLRPERLIEVASGSAQDGGNDTIILNASDSALDIYAGMYVRIAANTGSGQARHIIAYNGAAREATVEPNWETNPAAGSTYVIGFLADDAVNAVRIDAAISTRSTLGGTAQTGDSYARLGAPAGASVSADIAAIAGGGGATAAEVWQYGQRSLTQVSTAVINDPLVGNDITCIIATTLSVTWSGLAVAIGGTEEGALMFTAKRTLKDPDSTALLQVLVTVAADAGDGLQRYMGLAAGGYKAMASLSGDIVAHTVRLDVEDDVTALLTAQKVYYDVKQMLADGSSSILVSGIFEAVYTPTMTINL